MASGILGIALTGLNAAQAGIRTTEHNIANVNTAGYRRQEVGYGALLPSYTGSGYFGNGVGVETVRSYYSQFLENEVLVSQTRLSYFEAFSEGASLVDKVLGDSGSGMANAIDSFFSAVNELASEPTSNAARQVLVSAGNNLAGRFNALDGQLRATIASANKDIASLVSQANLYASQVVRLNSDIARAESANTTQTANDLRDQRQQLVNQLNKLMNLSAVQQSDGSLNLFIGSGQPLVVGNVVNTLSTAADPDDPSLLQPTLVVGGTSIALDSELVTGGRLGGLLGLREEIVLPALQDLNRLALALGSEVNRVHATGSYYDAVTDTMVVGGLFFSNPVVAQGATDGQFTMTLVDDTKLDPTGYDIALGAGGSYTVKALSTGTSTVFPSLAALNAGNLGFTLTEGTPVPANGDSWRIGDYARSMVMTLTQPSRVAAASAGADGPGDNSNARALADLRFASVLDAGTTSFSTAYSQTIGRTASRVAEADLSLSAYTSLTASAEAASRGVSGVNMDEEAANLIRFQQSYQAAAKAIQVASVLFDEILGLIR